MTRLRNQSIALFFLLGACSGMAYADANGPDPGLSGVPGEAGPCANCHGSGASSVNTNGGKLALNTGTTATYVPGEIQHWIVTIADPSAKRWGFQAAAPPVEQHQHRGRRLRFDRLLFAGYLFEFQFPLCTKHDLRRLHNRCASDVRGADTSGNA